MCQIVYSQIKSWCIRAKKVILHLFIYQGSHQQKVTFQLLPLAMERSFGIFFFKDFLSYSVLSNWKWWTLKVSVPCRAFTDWGSNRPPLHLDSFLHSYTDRAKLQYRYFLQSFVQMNLQHFNLTWNLLKLEESSFCVAIYVWCGMHW